MSIQVCLQVRIFDLLLPNGTYVLPSQRPCRRKSYRREAGMEFSEGIFAKSLMIVHQIK